MELIKKLIALVAFELFIIALANAWLSVWTLVMAPAIAGYLGLKEWKKHYSWFWVFLFGLGFAYLLSEGSVASFVFYVAIGLVDVGLDFRKYVKRA